MEPRHPSEDLVSYLRGDLAREERERITAHLESCGECRRACEETARLINDLRASIAPPPEINWGRYRAELRGKLERRLRRRWTIPAFPRLAPLALSAGVAVLALFFVLRGGDHVTENPAVLEEIALGSRLDLLEDYPLLERLDLLEDFDVVEQLDKLTAEAQNL